jgi:hypothetical protein
MEKKIFNLGVLKFTSPNIVGAGCYALWQENVVQEVIARPQMLEQIAATSKIERHPSDRRELTPEQEKAERVQKVLEMEPTMLYQVLAKAFPYQTMLSILKLILTPLGDYTIEDGYNQASKDQVSAVTNFFMSSVVPQTVSEPSTTGDSHKKIKAKKAVEN